MKKDETFIEAEKLYKKSLQIVKSERKVSATILQRRLGVSFPVGARIMDLLETGGVIGPQIGARPREILIEKKDNRKNDFAMSILSRFEIEKNTSKRYDFLMQVLSDIEKEINKPTDF